MLNSFAPPFRVVATYFIFGFLYLIANLLMFSFFKEDFSSYEFKAFLHCFFAGFALNIIIGALYQLSSVIYEKAFYSIKGVFIISLIQNLSLSFMIYSLLNAEFSLLLYSIFAIFISLFYFVILFLLSFRDFGNIAKISIFGGVIFLAFGIIFALLISLSLNAFVDFDYEILLNLHIYFMLGFVFFICIGAASVLLPMFALTHNHKNTLLYIAFTSYFLAYFHKIIAIFSVVCFALWCLYIIKNRARRSYDFWNINVIFSAFGVFLASAMYYLNDYRLSVLALVYSAIMPFIIAHVYKILPFLIWYHYISKFAGICKVPLLNDLVITPVAYVAIFLNLALVVAMFFGFSFSFYIYITLKIMILINVINFFTYVYYKGE